MHAAPSGCLFRTSRCVFFEFIAIGKSTRISLAPRPPHVYECVLCVVCVVLSARIAEVVELLLSEGKANVAAADVQGASPLHQAVLNGHKAIGLALLSKCAAVVCVCVSVLCVYVLMCCVCDKGCSVQHCSMVCVCLCVCLHCLPHPGAPSSRR